MFTSLLPRFRLAFAVAAAVTFAACGGDDTATETADPSSSAAAASDFPLEVDSCGESFTLDRPPSRVVILGSDPISQLDAVDALDRVVAKTGNVPTTYYDDDTNAAVAAIPTLTAATGPTGGTEISQEEIIDQQPDLVIGYETETITRAGLRSAGIPLYVIPAFCPDGTDGPVSFDDVYEQVALYGAMFDAPEAAAAAADEMRTRVAAVTSSVAGVAPRTGATLYVADDGSTLYAYGPDSMAHPQLMTLGIENVFGDLTERVVEITREELIDRNPDVLVLLYGDDGDPDAAEAVVRDLPGAEAITAVASDQIVTQPFPFTDPPNPLSVTGLEHLAERLAG